MKLAKIISLIGTLAMAAAIGYALIVGDFAAEGAVLTSMPWGIVSLVDLYVGFSLFALWIVYREGSWITAVIWVFFLMTLGFFTGALYTFIALQRSNDDWQRFWHGARA